MPPDDAALGAGQEVASVIVPVRNAVGLIGHQLEALLGQDYESAWELIVVDNGSDDGSMSEIEGIVARHIGSRPSIRVATYTERRGHASPRNFGASLSTGQWLAFCDADDIVDQGWLRGLMAHRSPVHLTTSTVVPLDASMDGETEPLQRPPQEPPELFGLPVAHTCGMLCPQRLFEQLGGFDPHFDIGGADADFSIRAQTRAGAGVLLAPTAIYRLRLRSDGKSGFSQAYRYGRSRVRLFARHQAVILEGPSSWGLLGRKARDIVRHAPDLVRPGRRIGYLRMIGNITARVIWSTRLRVRYF